MKILKISKEGEYRDVDIRELEGLADRYNDTAQLIYLEGILEELLVDQYLQEDAGLLKYLKSSLKLITSWKKKFKNLEFAVKDNPKKNKPLYDELTYQVNSYFRDLGVNGGIDSYHRMVEEDWRYSKVSKVPEDNLKLLTSFKGAFLQRLNALSKSEGFEVGNVDLLEKKGTDLSYMDIDVTLDFPDTKRVFRTKVTVEDEFKGKHTVYVDTDIISPKSKRLKTIQLGDKDSDFDFYKNKKLLSEKVVLPLLNELKSLLKNSKVSNYGPEIDLVKLTLEFGRTLNKTLKFDNHDLEYLFPEVMDNYSSRVRLQINVWSPEGEREGTILVDFFVNDLGEDAPVYMGASFKDDIANKITSNIKNLEVDVKSGLIPRVPNEFKKGMINLIVKNIEKN